jgi:hypothetical protein
VGPQSAVISSKLSLLLSQVCINHLLTQQGISLSYQFPPLTSTQLNISGQFCQWHQRDFSLTGNERENKSVFRDISSYFPFDFYLIISYEK